MGRFFRELSWAGLKLVLAAIVVFGLGLLAVTRGPDLLGGGQEDTTPTVTQPTVPVTTTVVTLPPTTTTTLPAATTTTVPPTTTTTAPLVRDPSEITVQVLNATTRSGLAARVTSDLQALGYQTLQAANSGERFTSSRVWYASGFAAEAFELAAQFPDGLVEAYPGDAPTADIVVVLGSSYQG